MMQFVDDTHVLIGAGGGGKRFGMANILLMLSVDVSAAQGAGAAAPPEKLWRYETAIDLEGDVPWCASEYLPIEAHHGDGIDEDPFAAPEAGGSPRPQLLSAWCSTFGLRGFYALSSIHCFVLIGVFFLQDTQTYRLRRLARVLVPSDERNPDKKPIALTPNNLVVAHDAKGIHVYALSALLPPIETAPALPPSAAFEQLACVTVASPLATWTVPARVNDLHCNRFDLTKTKARSGGRHGRSRGQDSPSVSPCRGDDGAAAAVTALVVRHLLIVAVLQDKTIRVGSFRLRRRYYRAGAACAAASALAVTEEAALDATKCHLPFALMPSSLRLVRTFALDDTSLATRQQHRQALVAYDHQRREGLACGPAAPLPLPCVAKAVIVVFDVRGNQSYFLTLNVFATWRAVPEGGGSTPSASASTSMSADALVVSVEPDARLSPLVGDAITCLSAGLSPHQRTDTREAAAAAPVAYADPEVRGHAGGPVCVGALPRYWVAGTVDGFVCAVGRTPDAAGPPPPVAAPLYRVERCRPAAGGGRRAKAADPRRAALHKEPITCVAYNDRCATVLTADIAQNVVVSFNPSPAAPLPFSLLQQKLLLFPPESSSLLAVLQTPKGRLVALVLVSVLVLLIALFR
ncbi:hypothetical protein STCU_09520 [Strigomonas culicis]|uniref:Uncharacterized protein n=1 Tax=Strigomonas culicis TaxID=28005 RepID=S9UXN4_9TRYP|nr:hypothetical protein STCU_09520 [Strigomonas culicis]|eukprot:EPY19326.1 hypothetical protein STCU_09520 [Strigomonas culicis]